MNEQERKEQNYIAKVPDKKNLSTKPMKGSTSAKKFKGKQDLRNNYSKGTNGMHNSIPLTKELQMMLGEGEVIQEGLVRNNLLSSASSKTER